MYKIVDRAVGMAQAEVDKIDFILQASGNSLTEYFPEEWASWDKDTLHDFILDNSWQIFKDLGAEEVMEFIEADASAAKIFAQDNTETIIRTILGDM